MTGDGVNDILALKEADCSVAMASGSDAAKNTAQLVLADNDFAHILFLFELSETVFRSKLVPGKGPSSFHNIKNLVGFRTPQTSFLSDVRAYFDEIKIGYVYR